MKNTFVSISLMLALFSANSSFAAGKAETYEPPETYLLTVPSGKSVDNSIAVAAIKAGKGTKEIDTLVELLKSSTVTNISVISADSEVAAASILAAIKAMNGEPSVSKIFFSGEKKYCDEVKDAAKKAGIRVSTRVAS